MKIITDWLRQLFQTEKDEPTPILVKKTRVLFILKFREVEDQQCGVYSVNGLSSGLFNSARMVNEMLNEETDGEIESKLVQVTDNNDIDREVTLYRPDVVIIEAFWVVPEKFQVLCPLHPDVKWVIRNHSNVPFLAQEGIAMSWVGDYVKQDNVYVATNTPESLHDLQESMTETIGYDIAREKVLYFPNYYRKEVLEVGDLGVKIPASHEHTGDLHVGCFGAIRPLKNHLVQAVAAIKTARTMNRHLFFHVNTGRFESGGLPVIHNLRGLFAHQKRAVLVEHKWMPHDEFLKLVFSMDIAIQVSLSETFNIVTADAVMMDVPVVVSPEVFWVHPRYQANPTNSHDVFVKMMQALHDENDGHRVNVNRLLDYNESSRAEILRTLVKVTS